MTLSEGVSVGATSDQGVVLRPYFAQLKDQLTQFNSDWIAWRRSKRPERTLMPGPLSEATDVERLLVVSVLRRDRLAHGLRDFLEFQARRKERQGERDL